MKNKSTPAPKPNAAMMTQLMHQRSVLEDAREELRMRMEQELAELDFKMQSIDNVAKMFDPSYIPSEISRARDTAPILSVESRPFMHRALSHGPARTVTDIAAERKASRAGRPKKAVAEATSESDAGKSGGRTEKSADQAARTVEVTAGKKGAGTGRTAKQTTAASRRTSRAVPSASKKRDNDRQTRSQETQDTVRSAEPKDTPIRGSNPRTPAHAQALDEVREYFSGIDKLTTMQSIIAEQPEGVPFRNIVATLRDRHPPAEGVDFDKPSVKKIFTDRVSMILLQLKNNGQLEKGVRTLEDGSEERVWVAKARPAAA